MGTLADRVQPARAISQREQGAGGARASPADGQAGLRAARDCRVAEAAQSEDRPRAGRGSRGRGGCGARRRLRRRDALYGRPSRARHRDVSGRKILSRRRRARRGTLRRGARGWTRARAAPARLSDPPAQDRDAAPDRSYDGRSARDGAPAAQPDAVALLVLERVPVRRSATAVLRHPHERTHPRAGSRESSSLAACTGST